MNLALSPEDFDGLKVAVLGAAKSGVAAANLLIELGAKVCLSDSRPLAELDLSGLSPSVQVVGGGNVLGDARAVVPSPGIPPSAPLLVEAMGRGLRLISEIELASTVSRAPIVAITGTDGKTTTTEMIGALCLAAGRPTVVAGNIGDPLSARIQEVGEDGVVVAEVSAFQLWTCGYFRPRVSLITNVAEDHADYFNGDWRAYAQAKARVLSDQGPGDTAILRADDPEVRAFTTPAGVRRVLFSPKEPLVEGFALCDGHLVRDGERLFAASELALPGLHNVANALSALAAGEALGLPLEAMCQALRRFKGLPHRLETIRQWRGVTFIDDSKATNPHAAAVGLAALKGALVVITGGFEKGLELNRLINALVERATFVVAMGQTGERTLAELGGRVPSALVPNMDAAVRHAASVARPGDTVVLSPAASSYDQFRSYVHRGQVFQAAVNALG